MDKAYFVKLMVMAIVCLHICYNVKADTSETFPKDTVEVLKESTVTASTGEKAIKGIRSGKYILDVSSINTVASFLGSSDILKIIQLMPGVAASGEMDTGIYMRGGDPGQNLTSLDGATIYSPSHLMGFFSVFNSDHISKASVYKSSLPASYGGRASGMIDVQTSNDINDNIGLNLNIGIISSQASLEIPFNRKHQLTISGRGTYANYLLEAIGEVSKEMRFRPKYGFMDFNGTYLYKPDDANDIKLNAYYGRDKLKVDYPDFAMKGSMLWHNIAASAIWKKVWDSGTETTSTYSFSDYKNEVSIKRDNSQMQMPSDIMDHHYKLDIVRHFSRSRLSVGGEYTYHGMHVQDPYISVHEFGAWADWYLWFDFPLKIDVGLRYSGAGNSEAFYSGPEPRLSISYDIRPQMTIKASLTGQKQYLSMVSISGMGMPTDFWVSVSKKIRPQNSGTISLGFIHAFHEGMFEYSVEPYFNLASNLLEFNGSVSKMLTNDYAYEDNILNGKGRNYGIEFLFKKNTGKVTGWLSYTLSRSERSFEDILDGKYFPAKHDRTHNISLALNYHPIKALELSAVFVYATGIAYTPQNGIYIIGENMIQQYRPHNSARFPDYNRLDISATYKFWNGRKCRHSFNLSVYNVYARKNPLYRDLIPNIEKDPDGNPRLALDITEVSLYSIVPAISYILEF